MNPFKRQDTATHIRSFLGDVVVPVDIRVIGDDPGSRTTRAVAVYRTPDTIYSQGGYYVCDVWDYTGCEDKRMCPNAKAESFGIDLVAMNESSVSRTEAVRMAAQRVSELLENYTWFVPGTEELVPGCWGFME